MHKVLPLLMVLLKSSPAWEALTDRHRVCATGAGSPAYRLSCSRKDCFCDKPKEVDEKLMQCVTGWKLAVEDPLDAYNGAMGFYANECGTFEFQKKEFLTQDVTYQNAAPTPAPNPGSGTGSRGGEATTTTDPFPKATAPGNSTTEGSTGGGRLG
ncbi:hypothetical protein QBC37DRAFT_484508, partial [Rhypophila decipiens]